MEAHGAEDNVEKTQRPSKRAASSYAGLPPGATFKTQNVFAKPSDFIKKLLDDLPRKERLARDQTLFMARFAQACDHAYEDDDKVPSERKPCHILLLG